MAHEHEDAGENMSMASIKEAAVALAGMETFEEGLRRRAEGLTWLLLGITIAGILCGAAAGYMLGERFPDLFLWPLQMFVPFIVWTAAGTLAIHAVWRSAALHAPSIPGKRMALRILGLLALLGVGIWILMGASYQVGLAHPEWSQNGFFTLILGLDAMMLGLWNVLGLTAAGRRTALGVGAAQVAVGAVVLLLQSDHPAAWAATVGAIPGAWFVGGLVQTLRG